MFEPKLNLDSLNDPKEVMAPCHCIHVSRLMVLVWVVVTVAIGPIYIKLIGEEFATRVTPAQVIPYPSEVLAPDRVAEPKPVTKP